MSKDSIKSFILSLTIHLVVLAAFVFDFAKKSDSPKISLVIDAVLISEVSKDGKHNHKKISSNKFLSDNSSLNKIEKSQEQESSAQKVLPIYQPLPDIPQELRYEAFNSVAIAHFNILPSGEVASVELVKPCANPRLNQLLLKALKNWKFKPSNQSNSWDVKVNFKVE